MLTVYDLMLLKESIDNEKILYIQFGNNEFVFKSISAKEYTQAKFLTSTMEELNDAVCQLALIYPEDYDFSESPAAGLSDRMSKHIIEESLLDNDQKVIDRFEESRYKLNSFLTQCHLFVKAAFSEYTIIDIENWNYEKLMDMTAKAEFVLKLKGSDYEIDYNKDDLENNTVKQTDMELIENGIDPMFYNAGEIELRKPFISYPVILGSSWDREDLVENVRHQILSRQNN